MSMRKRLLIGIGIILSGMLFAILGTFLLDFLVKNYGHEERFDVILGVGGFVIGCADLMVALYYLTDNMGEGIE